MQEDAQRSRRFVKTNGGRQRFVLNQFNDKSLSTNGKITSFTVSPDVGYFVINNLALGGRVSFERGVFSEGFTDIPVRKQISTTTSVSPFAKYYFISSTKRINLLADASYNWN